MGMVMDRQLYDLYEALEDLRKQTLVTLQMCEKSQLEDLANEFNEDSSSELFLKMKLVRCCAKALLEKMGEEEVREINRLDGYGCVD